MAGPFDWARVLTGDRDNPEDDIGQWADENQKRNRAALGLDANGNPLPAPAAAAPTAAAPGAPTPGAPTALPGANPAADGSTPDGSAAPSPGAQAAAQAQASSTLPPNQEPNATKTPVSLGHMMMNLQQYNEREQGFNQALGMGFAAFAQPRDRDMVSKMFNTTPADPMKIAQTQMSLGMQQQGQDRANAIGQMANDQTPAGQAKFAALAGQLHMDPAALRAGILADPGMAGKIAAALGTPSPGMATLTQLNNMPGAAGPGGAPGSTIGDIKSGIVGDLGGAGNSAMIQAQEAWRLAHKGQPDSAMPWTPNSIQSFTQWTADEKAKSDDRQTASNELNDKNLAAQTLQGDLETLKNHPGLKTIMTTPGHSLMAQNALNDPNATDVPSIMAKYVGLSVQEANAIALLRQIKGSTTESAMHSMAGTGSRVTQAEVAPLNDAINMTQNLNQGYDNYIHGAVNSALTRTKKVIAANYGNTGNVTNMDPEYAPWLDDSFKKGGQLYHEGSGADAIAAPKPIPADLLASAKKEAIDYPVGKEDLLDNLQQQGFDTRRLRKSDPGSW